MKNSIEIKCFIFVGANFFYKTILEEKLKKKILKTWKMME